MGRKRHRSEESDAEVNKNPPKKARGDVWKVPQALDCQVSRFCLTVCINWNIAYFFFFPLFLLLD